MPARTPQRPKSHKIMRKPKARRSPARPRALGKATFNIQRAVVEPGNADPETMLAIQRAYGNRATQLLTDRSGGHQTPEAGVLGSDLSGAIERSRGGGQPLAAPIRGPLEQSFQSEFGAVRVHTDARADTFNHAVQAKAFTLGHDIYFSKDNYNPGTASGKKLLAHELTHVVQQTGTRAPAVQRKPDDPTNGKQFKAADPKGQVAALHPSLQTKVQALIENAHKKGLDIFVFQGMRTIAEQDELYAQGRTKKGPIVTKAKGGESCHNYGVAVDIVFQGAEPWGEKNDWQALGAAGQAAGLEWGGSWAAFQDRPHFQLPGLQVSLLQSWYANGGMSNVWKNIGATTTESPSDQPTQEKQIQLPAAIGTAKVTATQLNVRQTPDAASAQLGALPQGTQVPVTGRAGVWLQITYQGKIAYIHGNYAEFAPTVSADKQGESKSPTSDKKEEKPVTNEAKPDSTAYFNIANQITSIMEGGSVKGDYAALTIVEDGGIVSYGKHQSTLKSGSLESILVAYLASSKSATAQALQGYMSRVKQKDVTLRTEKGFLDALRAAASEKEMQVAQDMVFRKGYWDPAVQAAQGGGLQSPLGFALLYDTKIQGGMEDCMLAASSKCGGNVGAKVGDKIVTELNFLKAFNDAREERLEGIAVGCEEKAAKPATKADEARQLRVRAQAIRASKYRCRAFRKLLEAGNLNVAGPGGAVEVLGPGGKAYQIEGFDSQKDMTSPTSQSDAAKDKPKSSPTADTSPKVKPQILATIGTAKITADDLNVRQGPDVTTAKLGGLTRGTQVPVTGRAGEWLQITYQGKAAYIHGNYAKFTPTVAASKSNFVDQTLQIGKGLVDQATQAGKDIWNWVSKQFDLSASKPAYENQRDNAYDKEDDNGKRVYGGVMCNVTTLAMQLETLAGNKEKAVEAAVQLLQKNGDKTPVPELRQKQLEDLLMLRFEQATKKNEWPTLLGKEYKQALEWHNQKIPWNQIACALNRIGLEFTAFVAKTEHNEPDDGKGNTQEKLLSEEYYRKTLGPLAEKQKATVMLSTQMTSGHIVLFAQALSDGILINDPYGALLKEAGASNYLTNGQDKNTAAKQIKAAGDQVIKDRLKQNRVALKSLMSVISPENKVAAKVPQNIGELNFYTWSEIKKFTIGKWNNILFKK